MFKRVSLVALLALGVAGFVVDRSIAQDSPATPAPDAEGFVDMFNGKDLTGWHGLEGFWSAKDGMIVGSETKQTSKQTFLVYTAMPSVADFEMHYKYKFASPDGNSGVQFRSKMLIPQNMRAGGYQADCDGKGHYDGSIYDEAGVAGNRGTMSNRGEKTVWDSNNQRHNEPLPDGKELGKFIHVGDWNDVILHVEGNHVTYTINGHLMTDLTDESPKALHTGLIALQIHQGFTMEIQFKDLKIKVLK